MRPARTRLVDGAYQALWTIWTKTPVHRVGNALIERIPGRPRQWVVRIKRRVRRREWSQPALRARLLAGHEEPLVDEAILEDTYRQALRLLASKASADEIGDYLEFGVYVGTSLLCMHRASRAVGMESIRLFGFDSFQGLPEAAAVEDGGLWQPGWYRAELETVREHLNRNGIDWARTTLVPGWFEDTLQPEVAKQHAIRKASVIMIDCDIYSSACTALGFCAPLIRDCAVIVFDDWNPGGLASKEMGEARAFKEFLAVNPSLTAEEIDLRVGRVFLVTRTAP
jgi:predicted O-methyltransferase YrrM